jgi:hypothetical protein
MGRTGELEMVEGTSGDWFGCRFSPDSIRAYQARQLPRSTVIGSWREPSDVQAGRQITALLKGYKDGTLKPYRDPDHPAVSGYLCYPGMQSGRQVFDGEKWVPYQDYYLADLTPHLSRVETLKEFNARTPPRSLLDVEDDRTADIHADRALLIAICSAVTFAVVVGIVWVLR